MNRKREADFAILRIKTQVQNKDSQSVWAGGPATPEQTLLSPPLFAAAWHICTVRLI